MTAIARIINRDNNGKRIGKILLISIIVGLFLRLLCMPLFSYEYDNYYWAVILENINSGNELYTIEGYYYTPIWGYIIGAYDILWSYLSPIGELGIRVPELFGIEDLSYAYHSATIVNPLFLSGLKLILIASDVLVGYLIYKEVLEISGSRKRSELAFALWFLCPIVIYMSGIQCMFDSISALLLMVCYISIKKEMPLIGGAMLAMAALLKIFPAICLPIFIAYIFMKNRETVKIAYEKIVLFIIGVIAASTIILMPDIMDGDIFRVMSFLTNRLPVETMLVPLMIAGTIMIAIMSWIIIRLMLKTNRNNLENNFRILILCALVLSVFMTLYPCPQYFIVVVPFLAIQISVSDRGYLLPWLMIGVATAFKALVMNNFGLLAMAAKYYGLVSYDWIISSMRVLDDVINGHTLLWWLNGAGDLIVDIAGILIILFATECFFIKRCPKYCSVLDRIKSPFKKKEVGHDE